ncbi:VOC family protein [Shewanella violacea]|uniref:Antigen, putative n=1 Tax=Shewanella violacea (strain JCM 10179 / CIP 106290 / LMG 19151 / DSS12) TaxID=637905 RepID=D4ZEE3_SHEVD|nr:VOC family protein [Shewanella violacea]BAJ00173.1 antigen, putative [Shewanella violacea DSS12]
MRINQYIQGQPCWVELASHDALAGKQFYADLFDWEIQDMPIPGGIYTMFGLTPDQDAASEGGDVIGAAYQMPKEMTERGVPTTWLVYFAVDSVDETVEKVKAEGGSLSMGPCDIGTAGRMAMFIDPEGARFAVWQAGDHIGARRQGEHGTLCWVELASRDPESAKTFYPKVLQWTSQAGDMPEFEYTEWLVGDKPMGGMLQMNQEWGDIPPHWTLYFTVDNCDETVAKARKLGGKECVPPTDIANVGRFAVINDPQGGFFSVITLNSEPNT